ncbi:MAG: DedA family protein [Anaerolineae bacterium]
MTHIINQIADFFQQLILTFGYPGIFLVLVAENVFTPIPTEPLMPLAGILAAQGHLNFFVVWLSALSGATFGSFILYMVGRKLGEPAVRLLVHRWGRYLGMTEGALDRALTLFNKYGGWVIFFGRFLPVVRPTVSLVSGMSKLSLWIYLPFTLLSTALVTFIYITAGYLLGENWRSILTIVDQNEPLIIAGAAVIGIAVIGYLIWRWHRVRILRKNAVARLLE